MGNCRIVARRAGARRFNIFARFPPPHHILRHDLERINRIHATENTLWNKRSLHISVSLTFTCTIRQK